jgi:hypothetical protein
MTARPTIARPRGSLAEHCASALILSDFFDWAEGRGCARSLPCVLVRSRALGLPLVDGFEKTRISGEPGFPVFSLMGEFGIRS